MYNANFPNGVLFYKEKAQISRETIINHLKEKVDPCIDRTWVIFLEGGHVVPTPQVVEALAEILGVTPGHLFTTAQIKIIYSNARQHLPGKHTSE
jgi:DNA-binding XRE family transcriptional regulator